MSGHTPGPWEVIKEDHDISISGEGWFDDQHVNGWVIVGNPNDPGMAIAIIDTGYQNQWQDEVLDANAALAAAAPDLLAVAQGFVAALDGATTDYDQLATAARAAIARATPVSSRSQGDGHGG